MLGTYILCWFLMAVIAIANGVLRELTFGKVLPELAAHQLSSAIGFFSQALLFGG